MVLLSSFLALPLANFCQKLSIFYPYMFREEQGAPASSFLSSLLICYPCLPSSVYLSVCKNNLGVSKNARNWNSCLVQEPEPEPVPLIGVMAELEKILLIEIFCSMSLLRVRKAQLFFSRLFCALTGKS